MVLSSTTTAIRNSSGLAAFCTIGVLVASCGGGATTATDRSAPAATGGETTAVVEEPSDRVTSVGVDGDDDTTDHSTVDTQPQTGDQDNDPQPDDGAVVHTEVACDPVGRWRASEEGAQEAVSGMFGAVLAAASPSSPSDELDLNLTVANMEGTINADGTMTWDTQIELTAAAPDAGTIEAVIQGHSEFTWTSDGSTMTVTSVGFEQEGFFTLAGNRFPIGNPPAPTEEVSTFDFECHDDTLRFAAPEQLDAAGIQGFPTVAVHRIE